MNGRTDEEGRAGIAKNTTEAGTVMTWLNPLSTSSPSLISCDSRYMSL